MSERSERVGRPSDARAAAARRQRPPRSEPQPSLRRTEGSRRRHRRRLPGHVRAARARRRRRAARDGLRGLRRAVPAARLGRAGPHRLARRHRPHGARGDERRRGGARGGGLLRLAARRARGGGRGRRAGARRDHLDGPPRRRGVRRRGGPDRPRPSSTSARARTSTAATSRPRSPGCGARRPAVHGRCAALPAARVVRRAGAVRPRGRRPVQRLVDDAARPAHPRLGRRGVRGVRRRRGLAGRGAARRRRARRAPRRGARARSAWRAGTLVVCGCGDEMAATLGAGVVDPGVVCNVVGTAEPICAVTREPCFDPTGLVECHPHADPETWLLENPGFVSGGGYRWFRDHLGQRGARAAPTTCASTSTSCSTSSPRRRRRAPTAWSGCPA